MIAGIQARWLAALLTAAASGAAPAAAANLTTAHLAADPRLERRVTVRHHRVHVGALLEELSHTTGVSLAAAERDGAADEEVLISAREVPLGGLLRALWSQCSFRGAEWHWERTGSAPEYRYRLTRPLAARLLAARLREAVQREFEEDAERLVRAAQASPAVRERLAESDLIVRISQGSPSIWLGLQAFGLLPAEERLRVLRGERAPLVRLEEERGPAWDLAQTLYNQMQRRAFFQPLENPERGPGWIRFSRMRFEGWSTQPCLMIEVEGLGAQSYLNGTQTEERSRERLGALWRVEGDTDSDPETEARDLPDPGHPGPAPPRGRERAARLVELGDTGQVPVLAVLERHSPGSAQPGPLQGRTVGDYLAHVQESVSVLLRKWHGGWLLYRYAPWFQLEEDAGRIPYAAIRELKPLMAGREGFLSPAAVCLLAARLTPEQLAALGPDYPPLQHVAPVRALLAVGHRQPDLWRRMRDPVGVPLAELLRVLEPAARAEVLAAAGEGAARCRARVLEEDFPGANPPTARVMVEVYAPGPDGARETRLVHGVKYEGPRRARSMLPGG